MAVSTSARLMMKRSARFKCGVRFFALNVSDLLRSLSCAELDFLEGRNVLYFQYLYGVLPYIGKNNNKINCKALH